MKVNSQDLALLVCATLRDRRRSLGVPQVDVAALAGIEVHTLSNLESGKGNPSLDVLERLRDCLGLELTIAPRVPGSARTAGPVSLRGTDRLLAIAD